MTLHQAAGINPNYVELQYRIVALGSDNACQMRLKLRRESMGETADFHAWFLAYYTKFQGLRSVVEQKRLALNKRQIKRLLERARKLFQENLSKQWEQLAEGSEPYVLDHEPRSDESYEEPWNFQQQAEAVVTEESQQDSASTPDDAAEGFISSPTELITKEHKKQLEDYFAELESDVDILNYVSAGADATYRNASDEKADKFEIMEEQVEYIGYENLTDEKEKEFLERSEGLVSKNYSETYSGKPYKIKMKFKKMRWEKHSKRVMSPPVSSGSSG
jgi:hypothetical protein